MIFLVDLTGEQLFGEHGGNIYDLVPDSRLRLFLFKLRIIFGTAYNACCLIVGSGDDLVLTVL